MIDGVVYKELVTHHDERGYFREVVRVTDDFFKEGFAQWNHSMMHVGIGKAWHIHKVQIDWWYVVSGVLKVALHDTRKDSPTYRETMTLFMGDDQPSRVVRVPQGVAHGCKAIAGPVHLFYLVSHVYDKADDGRIPHDDPEIGYDWLNGPPIK